MKIAVLIGRFQMFSLQNKDKALISEISKGFDKLVIVVGLSPVQTTKENPLDYGSRNQMIEEGIAELNLPSVLIRYIKDENEDSVWSENLDNLILHTIRGSEKAEVTIYGRKETVFDHYTGKFNITCIDENYFINDQLILKELKTRSNKNEDFRAGCMYAALNQYDNPIPTVDIAVINEDQVLLGRKENETKYRFIGGFAESDSESYEDDALRELAEEVGKELKVCNLKYICSKKINDWRYRNERKKIKTIFFRATYVSGTPRASDDIYEITWKKLSTINPQNDLMPEHIPLFLSLTTDLRGVELGINH